MRPQMQILPHGAYPFLRLDDQKLLKECRVDPYQASGPGGQKRNRTYSAIRITHLKTGISTIAEESRSQSENKARALRRLRTGIALSLRPDCSPDQFQVAQEMRALFQPGYPININVKNPTYPIFCATIMDALFLQRGMISEACKMLRITSGQLGKVLRKDTELYTAVNRLREQFGLRALRTNR